MHPKHSPPPVKPGRRQTNGDNMLKFRHLPALLTVIPALFLAGFGAASTEAPAAKPDPAALLARAQAEGDPAMAFPLYCEAARAGSGPAQAYVGRTLADAKGERPDIAAGMLWLDMAIRSGDVDAKALRRAAGRIATPKDFERYRVYNNSQRPLPCEPVEEIE